MNGHTQSDILANIDTSYTPLSELPKIYKELNDTFLSRKTRSIEWRKQQLLQLARLIKDNHEAIASAILTDLGRPYLETYQAELAPTLDRTLINLNKVSEWAATEEKSAEVPDWQKSWDVKVFKEPKGVALIIAPWNYPCILSIQPFLGALSAGCPAVLKVSEIAPTYGNLLRRLFDRYMDRSAYRVVTGGVEEITSLLEMKWDHIFYTGNGTIARIIAAAAAKHLTPVTLELGGKSPVIIDPSYPDVDLAAKRLLYGKTCNAGQICVSPDYVLIPNRSFLQPFLQSVAKAYNETYFHSSFSSDSNASPGITSPHWSKIVSDAHYKRISSLISKSKGRIIHGGKGDPKTRKHELTIILLDHKEVEGGWEAVQKDSLMEGENFGPVLPIVVLPEEAGGLEGACEFIRKRDHPLVLYAFTEDDATKELIRDRTLSGSLVFNDTFMQLAVNEMPFGGVGESGYGRQILKNTFDLFTYERSSIAMPISAEPSLCVRYPPYTEENTQGVMKMLFLDVKIPESI